LRSTRGSTVGSPTKWPGTRVAPQIELEQVGARDFRAGLGLVELRRVGGEPGRHRGAGDAVGVGGDRLDLAAHRAPPPPLDVVEPAIACAAIGVRHGGSASARIGVSMPALHPSRSRGPSAPPRSRPG